MARKPGSKASGEFVMFDVYYEDGTQRSNRKVPRNALTSLEGDAAARAIIEEQDQAIAQKSGKPPVPDREPPPIWRRGNLKTLNREKVRPAAA